jgi:hypothetical protein
LAIFAPLLAVVAPIFATLLAVVAPFFAALHPWGLSLGLCDDEDRGWQPHAYKRKRSSTRNQCRWCHAGLSLGVVPARNASD